MKRKVLYSPGYGAGWATWNSRFGKALCTDETLVDMVERGEHKTNLEAFEQRCREIVGAEEGKDPYICYLGVDGLEVAEVSGPFRIDEYDGSESVIEALDEVWW